MKNTKKTVQQKINLDVPLGDVLPNDVLDMADATITDDPTEVYEAEETNHD